jgi:hypothetical protein
MRMLSLAFTPRFVCYTLSILFAATPNGPGAGAAGQEGRD